MIDKPLIIIGAGGHAKVALDTALSIGHTVLGLVDARQELIGNKVLGISIVGNDTWVENHDPDTVLLVMGIGSVDDTAMRRLVYCNFVDKGYEFASLVHPMTTLGRDIEIGSGTVVMAGAVIQTGCKIGQNVIVNTGARIDHDGKIGDHTHIAPGAILSGNVEVGKNTHVGVGAMVIQGVVIGENSLVAAGAVVVKPVAANSKIMRWAGK